MMTLVFDGLIVLVIVALIFQILRVEKRLRRLQSSFGAMRALVEEFSVRVDKSKTLFDEMRIAGKTIGAALEQSMDACARQNRELRVLLAHCRRAEQRLRSASADAAQHEPDGNEITSGGPLPASSAPPSPPPSVTPPLPEGTTMAKASAGSPLRKWSPPHASAKHRPEVADLLASIRTYNGTGPEDMSALTREMDQGERP